jgi:UDP-perosamine 4-acetyltransferase
MDRVVGIGAGGHAKVIIDILRLRGEYQITGLVDSNPKLAGTQVLEVPVLGGDDELQKIFSEGTAYAFVGIASLSDTLLNKRAFDHACALGFQVINVVHPSSIVSPSVCMGGGNRIFAGAIINPDAALGNNVVINTGAIIEHDCVIGDHAQIAPGAQLAGNVTVGEGSIVGIGASVIQGVRIGSYSTVGSGAVVIDDVPDSTTVVGVPAKPITKRSGI